MRHGQKWSLTKFQLDYVILGSSGVILLKIWSSNLGRVVDTLDDIWLWLYVPWLNARKTYFYIIYRECQNFHSKIFKKQFLSKFTTKKFRKSQFSTFCASDIFFPVSDLERRGSMLSRTTIILRRKASSDFFSIFWKSVTMEKM